MSLCEMYERFRLLQVFIRSLLKDSSSLVYGEATDCLREIICLVLMNERRDYESLCKEHDEGDVSVTEEKGTF